jgi:nitrogen fixation protein FixH
MVYQSTLVERNLVVENYYEKDLQYQSHLDKLKNSSTLKKDLGIFQNKEEKYLRFSFPKELADIKGDILFYRPSDSSKDFNTEIKINDEHELRIPTSELQSGVWKIKVNWEGDKRSYYKEATIQI